MLASDAERERAVEALRHSFADGRITAQEFEERVERAYDARTRATMVFDANTRVVNDPRSAIRKYWSQNSQPTDVAPSGTPKPTT